MARLHHHKKTYRVVEQAVYKAFEAISDRSGVLGAMETMSQQGKNLEERLYYGAHKPRR